MVALPRNARNTTSSVSVTTSVASHVADLATIENENPANLADHEQAVAAVAIAASEMEVARDTFVRVPPAAVATVRDAASALGRIANNLLANVAPENLDIGPVSTPMFRNLSPLAELSPSPRESHHEHYTEPPAISALPSRADQPAAKTVLGLLLDARRAQVVSVNLEIRPARCPQLHGPGAAAGGGDMGHPERRRSRPPAFRAPRLRLSDLNTPPWERMRPSCSVKTTPPVTCATARPKQFCVSSD